MKFSNRFSVLAAAAALCVLPATVLASGTESASPGASPTAAAPHNEGGPIEPVAPTADRNADAVIAVGDLMSYLTSYFARDGSADMNGDGIVGNGDLFAYLALWFAKV